MDRDISHQTKRSEQLQQEITKLTEASKVLQEKIQRFTDLQDIKKCSDFIQLPEEEQAERKKTEIFNGTKFGKGRYKAHHHASSEL